MAITLHDMKERLESIDLDIVNCDYGQARQRVLTLIGIIENQGIVIHAIIGTEDKKVNVNGD